MTVGIPTERQIALFSAMEDIHDLTRAVTVILVDAEGATVAVGGDEDHVPAPLRAVLGGRALAEAGSVRALLEPVDLEGSLVNITIFDVDGAHLLAILFDAEADFATVQEVGKQGKEMLAEILAATRPSGESS